MWSTANNKYHNVPQHHCNSPCAALCIIISRPTPSGNNSSFKFKLRALQKHTTAPKAALCVLLSTVSFSRRFLCGLDQCPTSTTDQGETQGPVWVDTGVSLSTHASSINSSPSGRLISCRGRKWEGGQGSEQAAGMMMSEQEIKTGLLEGESTANERADGAKCMWTVHEVLGVHNLWLQHDTHTERL